MVQSMPKPFRITEIKTFFNAIWQLVNNHEAKPKRHEAKQNNAYDTYAELLELRENLPPKTTEIIAGI